MTTNTICLGEWCALRWWCVPKGWYALAWWYPTTRGCPTQKGREGFDTKKIVNICLCSLKRKIVDKFIHKYVEDMKDWLGERQIAHRCLTYRLDIGTTQWRIQCGVRSASDNYTKCVFIVFPVKPNEFLALWAKTLGRPHWS